MFMIGQQKNHWGNPTWFSFSYDRNLYIACLHITADFLRDDGKISKKWTDSFLKKNPPSPRKSAVIFLLVWQSTTVCGLSNDGGFPTENQRGNLPWFSLSCGRTIKDHVWPFQGKSIAFEIANFFFDPSKNDNLMKDRCEHFFRFLCERWQVTVLSPIYTIIHVFMQENH